MFLVFPALFLLSCVRRAFAWLAGGLLFFFFSLLWVRIAMIDYGGVFPPVAYSLILLLALTLSGMQFLGTYLLWKILGYRLPLLPFLWTAFELLRSTFPYGGFPWLLIGESFLDIPFLKLYLSAGGVYTASLLAWMLSITPRLLTRRGIIIPLLSFIIPLPFIKEPEQDPALRGIKVAIFQTNVPEEIKLSDPDFYRFLPKYWIHFKRILEEKPDLIFLPESAFPFRAGEIYKRGHRLLYYSLNATIVTGLVDIRRSGGKYEAYNSVFVIDKGSVRDFYDKMKPLPFGEFVPFPFQFVKKIFGIISGIDYSPGREVRCLRARNIRVGTPICFEVSYYWLVREMAECSNLIAVLTNDAWFRDSDGTYQHFRQARVRALENRKYVLWVNNTGPSAVISPDGDVLKEIPYGKMGYIAHEFR